MPVRAQQAERPAPPADAARPATPAGADLSAPGYPAIYAAWVTGPVAGGGVITSGLGAVVGYLEAEALLTLTADAALAWAMLPAQVQPFR
jgi:hypothetical protein